MAMRRPRGSRRPSFRGRSGSQRRPRAHYSTFQPPRNFMAPSSADAESYSSDTLDFMPLHNDAVTSPQQTPTNSVTFEQPPTELNTLTSSPRLTSPKPLMPELITSVSTQSIPPPSSQEEPHPPQTSTSIVMTTASSSTTVSNEPIDRTDGDGSVSPTDQYLYGLDSDVIVPGDSSSSLGKRKEHPQSDGPSGSGGEGAGSEHGEEIIRDKETLDRNLVESAQSLSKEEIMEVNKRAIGVIGLITNEMFLCNLCLAQLNSRKNLQKHLMANEHVRRVYCLLRDDLEKAYRFCKVCYVKCLNEEVYSQHMNGKKHLKNVQLSERIKGFDNRPVGPILEDLLKEEVVKEGDGLSLGLSPSMMKFFSLKGPFIGLQYAEEVGTLSEINPKYNCTLCKIMTDAGNHYLHFTSTTHRLNVLKQDYPEKYQLVRKLMASSDKKSDVSGKLKEVVAEIEAREGRKVELIKRKVLKEPPNKPRRSGSGSSGSSLGNPPNSKRGRGSLSSSRGRDWSPWGKGWATQQSSFSSDTPPFTSTQTGGYKEGNRGRGGYNNRGGVHGSQTTPTSSSVNKYYYDFSENNNFGRVSSGYQEQPIHPQPYGQPKNAPTVLSSPVQPLMQTPHSQPPQPLMSLTTPQTPSSFSSPTFQLHSQPTLSSPPPSHGQWPPSQSVPPPTPPVALTSPNLTSPSFHTPLQDASRLQGVATSVLPGQQVVGGQFGSGRSLSGNEAQVSSSMQKLANAQIDNEDDAEKALQLSSALTQALLAYRIKKVSSSSNPISSLLNTLDAVRGTSSQFPQQPDHSNLHKHTGHQ